MQIEADAARALVGSPSSRLRCRCCRAVRRAAPDGSSRSAPRRSPPAARRVQRPARLRELARELRVDVAPFAQAQERNEVRAAGVDELAVRQLLRERVGEELPQRDQRQEIRALVAELAGAPGRPPAACSSGRSRGSGTDSALAITSASARQPRSRAASTMRPMRGSSGSRASSRPSGVSCASRIDRAELLQQLVAVGDRARRRRLEERKRVDLAEIERRHAQDHRRRASCAGSPDRCTRGRAAKSSSP